MAPYYFWFGRFQRKSVAQVMFLPGGYEYLTQFVLGTLTEDRYRKLRERIVEVVALGKDRLRTLKCVCGQSARYVLVEGSQSVGHVFLSGEYCSECRPTGRTWLEISFAGRSRFSYVADQKKWINHLRKLLGFSGRVTANRADAFFFPPSVAASDPDESPSRAKDRPSTTPKKQLVLL